MDRYGAQGGMGGYSGYGGMPNNAAPTAGGGAYGGDGSANMQLQQLLLQQLQGTTSQQGGMTGSQPDPYAADRQVSYDPYASTGQIYHVHIPHHGTLEVIFECEGNQQNIGNHCRPFSREPHVLCGVLCYIILFARSV
jgi:hypothetical protein